jgi:hypothetical protein
LRFFASALGRNLTVPPQIILFAKICRRLTFEKLCKPFH